MQRVLERGTKTYCSIASNRHLRTKERTTVIGPAPIGAGNPIYSSGLWRTLKSGGELLACFYIAGEQRVADWLAKTIMTRMGWFTPPFDTANDVRKRLEPYYEILDFHVEGAMLYFRAKKR